MNTEILNALIEMVKQGGVVAIWALGIYLVTGVFKLICVLWVVIQVSQLVMTSFSNYVCLKFISHKCLSLLSETSSKELEVAIRDYQKSSQEAMKSFMKEAKDLLGQSEKQVEKSEVNA